MITNEILVSTYTNKDNNLYGMSKERPVLLVFLRHFGCIYCREALHDLAELRKEIEDRNVQIVIVHLSDIELAKTYLEKYSLEDIEQVSDPDCDLYAKFGLVKGSIGQLFGLKVWTRGFGQMAKGNMYSIKQIGDSFQMPGLFVIVDGVIKDMFIHNSIADKPNYIELIDGVIEKLK